MTNKTMHVTLRELGKILCASEKGLPVPAIREIPFYGRHPVSKEPAVLSAKSIKDLASIYAWAIGLAYLNNKKDELRALEAKKLSKDDYAKELAEIESAWLVQTISRSQEGVPKTDPESGLPTVLLDANKLGALLSQDQAARLIEGLILDEEGALKSLRSALASRATHPVKLSVDAGSSRSDVKGGYFKAADVELGEAFSGSLTEQDYLVPGIGALTCNAADQSNAWIAFTAVHYEGKTLRLPQLLLERPELLDDIAEELGKTSNDKESAARLLGEIAAPRESEFSGEPQVFCSDATQIVAIAPLMPLSLPDELLRAKSALKDAFTEPLQEAAQLAEEAQETADAAHVALKEADPAQYPGGKAAHKAAVKAATAALAAAKAEAKVASEIAKKHFLSIPTFTLPIGGANPRNIASGLTKSLHNAPIYTVVREQKPTPAVGNKVFYPASLIVVPKIAQTVLPAAFHPGARGATHKQKRKAYFAAWAIAALEPLLDLKEAWEQLEAGGDPSLHPDAYELLSARSDAKALFAKGTEKVTGNAALKLFEDLIREVSVSVKDAVGKAFPGAPLGEYEAELREVVARTVLAERA